MRSLVLIVLSIRRQCLNEAVHAGSLVRAFTAHTHTKMGADKGVCKH